MPIRDWNGTTSTEIGTLYDNNGTTSAQIGNVYNHDGTANHLIYSAEQVVYSYGSAVLPMTNATYDNAGITANSDNTSVWAAGVYGASSAMVTWWTTDAIDLTSWNTITFIVKGAAYGNDGLEYTNGNHFIGVASNSYGRELSKYTKYVNLNPTSSSAADTKRTITLDISALTGSYHVGAALTAYRLYNYQNVGYVYSIILS